MRGFVPPPEAATNAGRSQDEMDDLLRAYFRKQMPNPWPELSLPVPSLSISTRPSRLMWSSRSALAAAIAFLLVGSLALSAAFHNHGPTAHSGTGPFTAKGDPFGFGKTVPTPDPDNDR